jgi:hypothetical protein
VPNMRLFRFLWTNARLEVHEKCSARTGVHVLPVLLGWPIAERCHLLPPGHECTLDVNYPSAGSRCPTLCEGYAEQVEVGWFVQEHDAEGNRDSRHKVGNDACCGRTFGGDEGRGWTLASHQLRRGAL